MICMNQLRLVAPYPRKIMRALYLFLVSKVMVQTDKQGMVYLTLEGYGEASKAAAYFDDVLATQQWVD